MYCNKLDKAREKDIPLNDDDISNLNSIPEQGIDKPVMYSLRLLYKKATK